MGSTNQTTPTALVMAKKPLRMVEAGGMSPKTGEYQRGKETEEQPRPVGDAPPLDDEGQVLFFVYGMIVAHDASLLSSATGANPQGGAPRARPRRRACRRTGRKRGTIHATI